MHEDIWMEKYFSDDAFHSPNAYNCLKWLHSHTFIHSYKQRHECCTFIAKIQKFFFALFFLLLLLTYLAAFLASGGRVCLHAFVYYKRHETKIHTRMNNCENDAEIK